MKKSTKSGICPEIEICEIEIALIEVAQDFIIFISTTSKRKRSRSAVKKRAELEI